MALALAMSLAGLNPDEFKGVIAKFTPAPTPNFLIGEPIRPRSPSTGSESSGIGSVTSSSPRSLEGSVPWPFPLAPMERSVRPSIGRSLWPTSPSSTATSVSDNGGSSPPLSPSSRASPIFSIDVFPSGSTTISSESSTPMEDVCNNETMDKTLVEAPGSCHNSPRVAANLRERNSQDVKPRQDFTDPKK